MRHPMLRLAWSRHGGHQVNIPCVVRFERARDVDEAFLQHLVE